MFGALLELTPETLPGIDRKEGHPKRYNRGHAPVAATCLSKANNYMAWVYEVQPDYQTAEPTTPTLAYYEIMLEGIRQIGLPESWIQTVKQSLPGEPEV